MSRYETPIIRDVNHMLGNAAVYGGLGLLGGWIAKKWRESNEQERIQEQNRIGQIQHDEDMKKFIKFLFNNDPIAENEFDKKEESDPKEASKNFANAWNLRHWDILFIDYRNGLKYNVKIAFDKWKQFRI